MTLIAGVGSTPTQSRDATLTRIGAVASAACLVMALALVADTVATVLRVHSSLPYFDEWADLTVLRGLLDGHLPLTALFRQHNEHRIFFPRLIFYTDDLVFGGRGILDGITIGLIQAGHAAMLVGLLRSTSPRGTGRWAIAAMIVGLLFCLRQEENFIWGFQVQFVGVFAGATLAFILFGRALVRARQGASSLALLCGAYAVTTVTTFTMANGLLAALVLVLLAIVARAPLRIIAATLAVTAVLMALYLHGYEPEPSHTPMSAVLRQPGQLVFYAAVYLGNFLEPDLNWAGLVGLAGLAGLALAAWRILRGRDRDAARLALFGIMLFTTATAAVTALGRVDFGLEQAFSSRYATGSATFWAALLTYLWSIAPEGRRPVLLQGAVAVLALALVSGVMRAQDNMKNPMQQRATLQGHAGDALILGLLDPGSFSGIFDNQDAILTMVPFLKSRHLSVFGQADAAALGQPIDTLGTLVDPGACEGSIDQAATEPERGQNGVTVSGHLRNPPPDRSSGRTYIVDKQNTIVGLAWQQVADDDPTVWTGFAVAPPGTELGAVARLGAGKLCRQSGAPQVTEP